VERTVRSIFKFGEQIAGYDIAVLNERAVRASAGILFLLAIIAFMNAWLLGNFQPTKIFVIGFLLDFSLRIFINPRYSPSLIVGLWFVRKQQPEYVGAPQKRFAWTIGLLLALTMLYLVVINNVIGPINLIVCLACLTLLFFEAAFGICLGCKLYKLFNTAKAQHCPGNACDTNLENPHKTSVTQIIVLLLFAILIAAIGLSIYRSDTATITPAVNTPPATETNAAEAERCRVPEFAKALGHEEKWKLHNNCK
jgi:hypothetical protein